MTPLHKPVTRRTIGALDGSFGPDRGKRLVSTLDRGDLITIRPERSRRAEQVSLFDVYRFAIRCRVNRAHLEKARIKKEKLAAVRVARKIAATDRRIKAQAQEVQS